MNPVIAVAVIIVMALVVVVGATGYAWWDYRTRPERYGYSLGERGGTRQAVHSWSSPRGSTPTSAPRLAGATRRRPFRWRT